MVKEPHTKSGRLAKSADRIKYVVISVIFAVVLALVFDNTLRRLHAMGGNLPGAIEGVFSLLIPIVFAIIGVYLVVHVLHPNFGKRPVPASLRKVMEDEEVIEDMTKEELIEFVRDLASKDEEIKMYLNTVSVKTDIATTLGISIVAFFAGMYGYMTSYTIEYGGTANVLPVSLCFMFVVFSTVYMILRTMNIVWDV